LSEPGSVQGHQALTDILQGFRLALALRAADFFVFLLLTVRHGFASLIKVVIITAFQPAFSRAVFTN